jgi:hypothetical protein
MDLFHQKTSKVCSVCTVCVCTERSAVVESVVQDPVSSSVLLYIFTFFLFCALHYGVLYFVFISILFFIFALFFIWFYLLFHFFCVLFAPRSPYVVCEKSKYIRYRRSFPFRGGAVSCHEQERFLQHTERERERVRET